MARSPAKEAIYDIALQWKNRCLLNNRSLLWPEEVTWTTENLERLFLHFVENIDKGSESFLEKLNRQIDDEPSAIHRIAADTLAIYCLFPVKGNMSQSTKLALIKTVSSWKAGSAPLLEDLGDAYLDGLGSAGMHYMNAGRHWQFAYIVNFGLIAHTNQLNGDLNQKARLIADEAQESLMKYGEPRSLPATLSSIC
jgi:hypothetical protein